MSTATHIRHIITTGLAMFSMFFGAGNIVFPLMVGQFAGNMAWWSIAGLMVTAVGVPFLGLLAMTFFNGDHHLFFKRIGTLPGYLVTLLIMIVIGPVNAIPRCISLSHGTISMYLPGMSALTFSILACVIIYLATFKKSWVVDLLGDVLSPLLVISLAVIIVKGLLIHPTAPVVDTSAARMLFFGLYQGYNTMDLLGTFFFSGVIIGGLKHLFPKEKSMNVLAGYALQASIIGATLLGAVYMGFGIVASYYGDMIADLSPEVLLGTIAQTVLGSAGGLFVSMAVALACLTTAITLVVVFAEFLQEQKLFNRMGYQYCLLMTLIASCVFANLGFSSIVGMMVPVLKVIYPALIVLCAVNLLHKWKGMHSVKVPFYLTVAAAFVYYNMPMVKSVATLAGA